MDSIIQSQITIEYHSPEQVYRHGKRLEGMTFRDVLNLGIVPEGVTREYNSRRYKGGMGTLIEERFFGYKANSDRMADFAEAGVELKATCIDRRKNGSDVAGERLVLTMIPYDEEAPFSLYDSHLWHKCQKMLLVWYRRDKTIDAYDQRIEHVLLFSPPVEDLRIIEADYRQITDLIRAGRADELSETIWANQWEPPGTASKQFAWRCYEERFGEGSCVNEDIAAVLDKYEVGKIDIPDVDMVVGGFPCQDYSVAKPLSQAGGIEGEKGVLWWSIYRFLQLKCPKYCLFENVDRLLKSPARQRGRDFAIILSCLASLGYSVEWRVVNSAEYGYPQRRKRVFIYAENGANEWDLEDRLTSGVMARALPIKKPEIVSGVDIPDDAYVATQEFNVGGKVSPFETAGVMQGFKVVTTRILEDYHGPRQTLGSVVIPESEVPEEYFVPEAQLPRWAYLKGSKREPRIDKRTGHQYFYSEVSMAFPDLLENPSRAILTGEGGTGASRFKHIIQCESGRYRRLVPDELDLLQTFPKGWTNTGMTDGRRAFCMGNALVVGVPHLIGEAISFVHEGNSRGYPRSV